MVTHIYFELATTHVSTLYLNKIPVGNTSTIGLKGYIDCRNYRAKGLSDEQTRIRRPI